MYRLYSREDLVESCFGMTTVEAQNHMTEWDNMLTKYMTNPANQERLEIHYADFASIKPFICKAQRYIIYGKTSVTIKDEHEASLLKKLYDNLI